MLLVTAQTRILVCVEPVDFRNGIDGLAALCRASLGEDPFRGTVFVFRNRRGTTLKALAYDGQGFWLCQKRLSEGRFRWWPSATDQRVTVLSRHRDGPDEFFRDRCWCTFTVRRYDAAS